MELVLLMKQDFKNAITNPVTVLFCLVYPLTLILLFGFLFSNQYTGNIVTSYDFYGVTMLFYLSLVSATIASTVFMEERIKKANLRVAYSPIPRYKIYLSKIFSTFILLSTTFTINMMILELVGIVNLGGKNFIYVLMLIIALLFFSITLGCAVCVILKNQDLTNKLLRSNYQYSCHIFRSIFSNCNIRNICR